MRILCVVSPKSGHLDFGGMGFVRLANQLRTQGHTVSWMASREQIGHLWAEGFEVIETPHTNLLSLRLCEREFRESPDGGTAFLGWLRSIHATMATFRPSLVLVDRILPMAVFMAEQLEVPCAAIGTPGVYREIRGGSLHAIDGPASAYLALGEMVRQRLGWHQGTLSSAWAVSQFLNVCFLGRSFYDSGAGSGFPAVYVDHFDTPPAESVLRTRFGVSFGNTGRPHSLISFIEALLSSGRSTPPLEIYTGRRTEVRLELERRFAGAPVRIYEWVRFANHFPGLRAVAFYGGVGTVWACVNHGVPMWLVVGNAGDQRLNGEAVARLGLGEVVVGGNADAATLRDSIERLCAREAMYAENIVRFRRSENFTDTLESAARKLTGTAG